MLLKSLSFSFSISNSGYTYKSSFKTQNSGYKSFTKSSFKQNIPATVTKVLQTQYSGYSLQKVPSNTKFWLQFTKSSFKHKILVTVKKVLQTKYSGYSYKSSFKQNIPVAFTKFLQTIFWLQFTKVLQTKYSGYSYKSSFKQNIPVTFTKFLQTHYSGYSLQKVPSNTKFWLQLQKSFKQNILVTVTKVPSNKIFQLHLQSSFKHNILVTVYEKFLQTQNSGYSLQKVPSNTKFWLQFTNSSFKHKILVTVTKVPSNKIFQLQLQKFLQQNSGYKCSIKIPKLLLTCEVFLVVQSIHFYIEVITVAKTCVPFKKKQNILILSLQLLIFLQIN